jgi:predicted enzyme related to lactoylglutathione lyase
MAKLNYIELPVSDVPASTAFFEQAFGWVLKPFGPSYAATVTGLTDIGLQGDPSAQTGAPLPVIEVDDLEAALTAVEKAGGEITCPIFTFPGGARFHVREPSGIELAVWTSTSQWDGPEQEMFVGEKKVDYRAG